jgi:hypothetical protein
MNSAVLSPSSVMSIKVDKYETPKKNEEEDDLNTKLRVCEIDLWLTYELGQSGAEAPVGYVLEEG